MSDPETLASERILICHAVANLGAPLPPEGKPAVCRWLLEILPQQRGKGAPSGDGERIGRAVDDWTQLGMSDEEARKLVSSATGVSRKEVKRDHNRHRGKDATEGLMPDAAVRDFCEEFLAGEDIERLIYDEGARYLVDRPTRQAAEQDIWRLLCRDYLVRAARLAKAQETKAKPKAKAKRGRPLSPAGQAAAEAEEHRARGFRDGDDCISAATMHGLTRKKVAKAIRNRAARRKK
ncbi:MAG TPA: hypothetical protein VGX71_05340 [Pseudaminobacter sp.]|nr:hypothetical protein [Pseudaminobacter sp.]